MKKYSRKFIFFLFLSVLLLVTVSSCGVLGKKLRFGTAGIGGTYYAFAEKFSDILKAEDNSWNVDVKVTAGSAENLRMLSKNYIELGIAQSDVIRMLDESEYAKGYGAVAALYTEACQFVVREDSGISSIRDLKDRKISVGETGSGSEQNAMQILGGFGVSPQAADLYYLGYTEAAEALRAGRIDAFFCTAGIPTDNIKMLAQDTGIRILPVEGAEADSIMRNYDHYVSMTIPAGTYADQTEDIRTLGVRAVLLADEKLNSGVVKELTQILFEHTEELSEAVSVQLTLTEEEAVKGIPVPFHKGAEEYYASKGISVNQKENEK